MGTLRTMTDVMDIRKADVLCVQETEWKGSKARSTLCFSLQPCDKVINPVMVPHSQLWVTVAKEVEEVIYLIGKVQSKVCMPKHP